MSMTHHAAVKTDDKGKGSPRGSERPVTEQRCLAPAPRAHFGRTLCAQEPQTVVRNLDQRLRKRPSGEQEGHWDSCTLQPFMCDHGQLLSFSESWFSYMLDEDVTPADKTHTHTPRF